MLWRAGDAEGAAEKARRILAYQPEHVEVHCLLTELLMRLDRPEQAYQQIQKALAINPEHGRARQLYQMLSGDLSP